MAATVYNTIQRLPRLAAVSRQRYAALLAVEIMRILLQGSKQAISLKLRHPQRLSPLSRPGQTLKLCFSRKKKKHLAAALATALRKSGSVAGITESAVDAL